MFRFSVTILCLALILAGCRDKPAPPRPIKPVLNQDPNVYGCGKSLYVFSVVGGNVLKVNRERGPILDYLGRRLNVRFRLSFKKKYDDIINSMVSGEADFAWLGPKTYLAVKSKVDCTPVAQILRAGEGFYEGVILVRKSEGFASVQDLKGKRLAFIDKQSTSGYIYPNWYFKQHSIDPKIFFGCVDFAETHSNALLRLINGTYDAVCTERGILQRYAKTVDIDKLQILAVTGRIPNGPVAVRPGLDKEFVERARRALLGMRHDPQGLELLSRLEAKTNFSGFGPVSDETYTKVKDIFLAGGTR